MRRYSDLPGGLGSTAGCVFPGCNCSCRVVDASGKPRLLLREHNVSERLCNHSIELPLQSQEIVVSQCTHTNHLTTFTRCPVSTQSEIYVATENVEDGRKSTRRLKTLVSTVLLANHSLSRN